MSKFKTASFCIINFALLLFFLGQADASTFRALSAADGDVEAIDLGPINCKAALTVGFAKPVRHPSLMDRLQERRKVVKKHLNNLSKIKSVLIRTERQDGPTFNIAAKGDRDSFITSLYEAGLLQESAAASAMALNKGLSSDIIHALIGEENYSRYFAKSYGFYELVLMLGLTDNSFKNLVPKDEFIKKINDFFPNGLVYKPSNSAQSRELGAAYFNGAAINTMYEVLSSHMSTGAIYSGITNIGVGYGPIDVPPDEFIVQELLPGFSESTKKMKEYRVHTLEDQVVPGATFDRWSWNVLPVTASKVEEQVSAFLKLLPLSPLRGIAWGIDVLEAPNGEIRIVEINASVAQEGWSGYLENPLVLKAYSKALERDYNVKFTGWQGLKLKTGTSNLKKAFSRARGKLSEK